MKEKMKKYSKQKDTKPKSIFPFDINVLNLFCSFVLSDNKNIRKNNYISMKKLFDIIDDESFKGDINKQERVDFIRKGLDARVVRNIRNSTLVIKYINGGLIEPDRLNLQEFELLSNDELLYINETVSACLKHADLNDYMYRWAEAVNEYNATEYKDRGVLVPKIEELTSELQNKFREHKVYTINDEYFSLREGVFEDVIFETHEALSDVSNQLKTGMQGFDKMLGGG